MEVASLLMNSERFEAGLAIAESLDEVRIAVQGRFWERLFELLDDKGVIGWPSEARPPDRQRIREFYNRKRRGGRANPRLDYDIGVCWDGSALVLRIELLPSRPLTYKLIVRTFDEPSKKPPVISRQEELQESLCKLRRQFTTSKQSLATGDLILPSGDGLDLALLTGRARQLLDENEMDQIIGEIGSEVESLINEVVETVKKLRDRGFSS